MKSSTEDLLGYVDRGARFSYGRKYRYRLWREWRGFGSYKSWKGFGENDGNGRPIGWPLSCLFIMLNPSSADETFDDPTIRRCVSYAQSFGYDKMEVVNLFAHCATDPAEILALNHDDDPVGPNNMEHIQQAVADAGMVICGWGVHGKHLDQDETVLGWLGDRDVYCLGLSKDGHPRHPLYLPKAAKPLRYRGRKV